MSLEAAFESFSSDATRLEGLPMYFQPEEQEAFQAVIDGQQPNMEFLAEWLTYLGSVTSAGKTHRRIRVVDEPATPYQQFELQHGYPLSIAAGEQTRIVPRSRLHRAVDDYWIFDRAHVFRLQYDNGAFHGSIQLFDEEASEAIAEIDRLWALAVPVKHYRFGYRPTR
ncbi:MAG TPA: hypothetical protein VK988_18545 [Acidimicrobiales bacterium]|nr:hypothetical protein [Acidimicrobiales bacterium]